MTEPRAEATLATNNVRKLGRTILSQLSPLLGTRATGTATFTATGADVTLLPNEYVIPRVEGRHMAHRLFKVGKNAATLNPNGTGGEWTVTSAGTSVDVVSAQGGERFNLRDGTLLRFDPPIAGLEPTGTVDAAFTGGTNGPLREANLFEDFDSAQAQRDFFDAKLGQYPAVMLTWTSSDPADGPNVGVAQGSTRKARQRRVFNETFALYVATGREQSDPDRRTEGLNILEDITALLTDRQCNDDGEFLSVMGACEVISRVRVARSPSSYVYALEVRCSRVLQPIDNRTFSDWNTTQYQHGLKADPPLTAANLVDIKTTMP